MAVNASGDHELKAIKIDRKLVKRPVMTYGYGATQSGIRKQVRDVLKERGDKLSKEGDVAPLN
jgi:DNA-directed RNA polymerase